MARLSRRRIGAVLVLIALAIGLIGWVTTASAGTATRESAITTPLKSDQTPAIAAESRSSRSVVPAPSTHVPVPLWGLGPVVVLCALTWSLFTRTTEAPNRLTRHRSRSLRSPPLSLPTLLSPVA